MPVGEDLVIQRAGRQFALAYNDSAPGAVGLQLKGGTE